MFILCKQGGISKSKPSIVAETSTVTTQNRNLWGSNQKGDFKGYRTCCIKTSEVTVQSNNSEEPPSVKQAIDKSKLETRATNQDFEALHKNRNMESS